MADTAIPIFQTVNEKGEATLEVEAVIKALGIKLPAGGSADPVSNPQSTIQWYSEINPVEDYIVGAGGFLGAYAHSNENAEPAYLDLKGYRNPLSPGSVSVGVGSNFESVQRTLITSNQKSSWLQIVGTVNRWKCGFNNFNLAFPGGSQFSNTYQVSHGLEKPPICMFCTTSYMGNTFGVFGEVTHSDSVIAEIRGFCAAGVPTTGQYVNMSWLAIG